MKNQIHEGIMNRSIQTFMKSEYVYIDELNPFDVAFVGVPVDQGASYRKGQDLAPKSIREHSYWDTVSGESYLDASTGDTLVSNSLQIADIGDVHISPTNIESNHERIFETIANIRSKCFPVIVGGDHSISYSTVRGCISALPEKMKKNFCVLHFDGHLDMEKSYLDFPRVFHGNPFRCLIEEGHVMGENHYSIGPRGIIPSYLIDYVKQKGVHVFSPNQVRAEGLNVFINKIVKEMQSKFDAVFISFDIDCIDGAEARGTGTPLEGGFTAIECQFMLRKMLELPIVGFELVEIAPALDPSGYTSIIGTNLLWQFLSFGLRNNGKIS